MQPEQQRVIGYFIEEANEHLDTIEQALLNLQGVVEDPEILNEVFRAAHSVKGGAAMLGLQSIQQVSHWLEDYFKVLKEHPIKVDQTLESLFLRGFDTLRILLDQLQGPSGLTQEVADYAIQEVEPVFAELKTHLAALVSQAGETPHKPETSRSGVMIPLPTQAESALFLVFQKDVPARLRDMLQLFKQPDQPTNRQQLQTLCQSLAQIGEQLCPADRLRQQTAPVMDELAAWSELIEAARLAIANPQNSYSTLAPVLIKEIKEARDRVLAGHPTEIFPSPQLRALISPESTLAPEDQRVSQPAVSREFQVLDPLESTGDLSDIGTISGNLDDEVLSDNWNELLFEAANSPGVPSESNTEIDLTNLFGDELSEEEAFSPIDSDLDQASQSRSELILNDLEALLGEAVQAETSPAASISSDIELVEKTADFSKVASEPLDDFSELETLLDGTAQLETQSVPTSQPLPASQNTTPSSTGNVAQPQASRQASKGLGEQTMRVPVKHLDSFGNLVGELVVNRNSLEQNQERLRQFLDNLLYQVQHLNDIGQQMQELYERSLLETSLLATSYRNSPTEAIRVGVGEASAQDLQLPLRSNGFSGSGALIEGSVGEQVTATHLTGAQFDALEMDRFTGFHTLSQEIIERVVRLREAASDIEFTVDATDQVSRMFRQATIQLQEGLNRSRMLPFAQVADRLPRAVRDIALKYGKQARLEVEGKDTLVDKGILEQLYDPMTHLVSNALIHGVEFPEVRQAAGKPAVGCITIRAFYQGNQTIISVSDDGAGIDSVQIKAKALKKGLLTPAEAKEMSQPDVYDLLFSPGFSTKEQVDDLAGRGVGMDVVRTSLCEVQGTINVDSTLGKGTTFAIRLPLTLSITKALCCIDNHYQIAFPIDGVEDIFDVSKEQIQANSDQPLVPWRDSLIAFRPLGELLTYNHHLNRANIYGSSRDDDAVSIVVLRSAGNFVALQVEQALGEQEIVIKQLGGFVPKPIGVAGVTVLGDGRIMPIADVLELIDLATGRLQPEGGRTSWSKRIVREEPTLETEPMVLIVDDSITVRELLSMTFTKAGYRVEQARDGQEAWEKLRSGLPCDLVFCDIEMPRMDGLELLSRIQKEPSLQHLPVAMLTSRGAERHRQMAIQLGAKAYFTKPYLEEALLDATRRMLNREVA